MGFIQQSNTKKIYAYLTQYARQQILDGNEIDFTVKYFSLHDNDVNYNISANLVNNSYNTLPSGFVPDITGDNQGCLLSIANGISLGNFSEPPQTVSLTGTVVGSCTLDNTSRFQINVTNIKGGTGEGFYWYVKTDVISFSSATTPIENATILSSTTSIEYSVGIPQYFNATFKFADTYLPREADSYNFTVYAGDSSDTEVEIGKFTDVNCSKRTFGWISYGQDINSDYQALNLITEEQLDPSFNNPISYISTTKIGFALFVIDNGNRRRNLNITQEDLDLYKNDFNTLLAITNTTSDQNCPWNVRPLFPGVRIPFNDIRDIEQITGQHSQSVLIDGAIIRNDIPAWQNATYDSLIPPLIQNNTTYIPYKGNFDALHPTVKPFSDMILNGFKISYVEIAPKYDPDTAPTPTEPIPLIGYRYTSASYIVGNDTSGNAIIKYNPPEIGISPVNANPDNNYSFQWAIYWTGPDNTCN
jgi:hypothetical protein